MNAIYVLRAVESKTIIENAISEQDPKCRLLREIKLTTRFCCWVKRNQESFMVLTPSYEGSFMVTPSCTLILACSRSTDPSIEMATASSARKFFSNTEHIMMIRETMLNGMTQDRHHIE